MGAACECVETALAHPILRRAAAAAARGELRREVPVQLRLAERTLVEGVVDLAFREPGTARDPARPAWTVVDFKTDREIESERTRYEAQLRLYATALERATREPAEAVLLLV